jgi:phosphomethylpyrimidine synthase
MAMCGPDFCSMKITEDVRKFAPGQGITEQAAIDEGLKRKATEFAKSGAEIYAKT